MTKKHLSVFASFLIMLCLGSLYAWSIIASELIGQHNFTVLQSQIVFGAIIAVFPSTMIAAGRLKNKISPKKMGLISGLLFLVGYLLASYSNGNFYTIFAGIGILVGIATGFGYWLCLTTSVNCFPNKKGLVTGIVSAGFGLSAVLVSEIASYYINNKIDILIFLRHFGLLYGLIIIIASTLIYESKRVDNLDNETILISKIIKSSTFSKLFFGIFAGTFAGLIIIGNLKLIASDYEISPKFLALGISIFAIANFSGRLFWGFISDYLGAKPCIFMALLLQAVAIILLNILTLNNASYLILSTLIGFGFGGNFVLFAKETAQVFGVANLGIVYPFVYLGHSFAGIFGPLSAGILYNHFNNFYFPIILACVMSLIGALLFIRNIFGNKKVIASIV
jgi:OFA family oxalate/formate antiporter-like MFS transporter